MLELKPSKPVYFHLSKTTLTIWNNSLRQISVSSLIDLYSKLTDCIIKLKLKVPQQKLQIILQSDNQKIIDQFNSYKGLYDIDESAALMVLKKAIKEFGFVEITYSDIPKIPHVEKKPIKIQTIKEMLDLQDQSANALIGTIDLSNFECIDISTQKPLIIKSISFSESVSLKNITKSHTVFTHPSNTHYPMDSEDPTVFCKYNENSRVYSFPPSRIGVIAPIENMKLIKEL
jgi:hypothetical protein